MRTTGGRSRSTSGRGRRRRFALAVFLDLPAAAVWGALAMGTVAVPLAAVVGELGAEARPDRHGPGGPGRCMPRSTRGCCGVRVSGRGPSRGCRCSSRRGTRPPRSPPAWPSSGPASEVLVCDDGSSDGTARIAGGARARVRHRPAPLPPGWLGKPHACAQLAAAGVRRRVRVPRRRRAARTGRDRCGGGPARVVRRWTWSSPHPRQEVGTVAERFVQPLLQWSILTFLPLRLAERSRPAVAVGGERAVPRGAARGLRAGGRARARRGARRSGAAARDQAQRRPRGGRRRHRSGVVPDVRRLGPSCATATASRCGRRSARRPGRPRCWRLLGLGVRRAAGGRAARVAGRRGRVRGGGGRSGDLGAAHRWATLADALAHPVSIVLFGYLTVRSHVQHARGTLRWKGRPSPTLTPQSS